MQTKNSNENNCIYQLLLIPQKCVPILALVLTSQHPFRNEEIIIISASGDGVKILLVMIKSRQEMIHSRRVHLLFWITHPTRYLGALSKRDILLRFVLSYHLINELIFHYVVIPDHLDIFLMKGDMCLLLQMKIKTSLILQNSYLLPSKFYLQDILWE